MPRSIHALLLSAVLAGAAAFAGAAAAQIESIEYYKTGIYLQTSNAAPSESDHWTFIARVTTSYTDDLFSVDLRNPKTLDEVSMSQYGFQWLWYSGIFPSRAALDSAFPDNAAYRFYVFGPVGFGYANLSAPPLFPTEVPHFSGDTHDQLQGMNPHQPFALLLDGFEEVFGASTSTIYIDIYNLDFDYFVFGAQSPSSEPAFTIPEGTLSPGANYVLRAVYSGRQLESQAFFGTADSIAAYDLHTELVFHTRACIADLDGVPGVDLADFFYFFNCFDASGPCADIDGQPGVDLGDYFAFFNAFDQGC